MELAEIINSPVLLAVCAGSFVLGALLMRVISLRRSEPAEEEDPRNTTVCNVVICVAVVAEVNLC